MKKKGFTLVELSIVLVIIGLLIGGILVGQSLIESAKINAQVRQIQQLDIAISNFKTKYKQMPGDSTLLASIGDASVGANNDGKIDTAGYGYSRYMGESKNVYPQLQAGVGIFSSYSFNTTSFCNASNLATTTPSSACLIASKVNEKSAIEINYDNNAQFNAYNFLPPRVTIVADRTNVNPDFWPLIPCVTALAIDKKIDDGIESTGNTMCGGPASWATNNNCGGAYNLLNQNTVMRIKILTQGQN